MELDELRERLTRFAHAMLADPGATVSGVEPTSGHAGFSYFFDITSAGTLKSYFLRLPPAGVKLEGTADVLRQVCVLKALDGTNVPHASVVWSGDDPAWFGLPYFVTPKLPGDILRGDWLAGFTPVEGRQMAQQAMSGLAGVHRLDWRAKCSYLGDFWGFEFDVTRWDRFYERAADQHLLALQPRVRQLLLDHVPSETNIGVYHGDFQWSNLLFDREAHLQAIIDWELTGIGATLNDVGWICAFNDPSAWDHPGATPEGFMPHADELEEMYAAEWGGSPGNVRWFRALAVYKFAIISGFNLMLHRRGKRHDPHWEIIAPSMKSNMEYALRMLTA